MNGLTPQLRPCLQQIHPWNPSSFKPSQVLSKSFFSTLPSQIPQTPKSAIPSSLISRATSKSSYNFNNVHKALIATGILSACPFLALNTDLYEDEPSHENILKLCEALGYQSNEGLCYGISLKGIEAILLGKQGLRDFDSRLQKIGQLFSNRENKVSIDPDFYIDFISFFDGVQLYQDAYKYKELFEIQKHSKISSQNHLDYEKEIADLTTSAELKAKGVFLN